MKEDNKDNIENKDNKYKKDEKKRQKRGWLMILLSFVVAAVFLDVIFVDVDCESNIESGWQNLAAFHRGQKWS